MSAIPRSATVARQSGERATVAPGGWLEAFLQFVKDEGPYLSLVSVSHHRGAVQLQIYCIRIVIIVYLFAP